MTRIFQAHELEALASFWRIHRRDGVTLGFTTHDRDLWLDGVCHRAAPGMVPSTIRRTAGLDDDGVDVEGVLAHDAIATDDLADGRFDGASVEIGVLDWENGDHAVLYRGTIGMVSEDGAGFTAALRSAKSALDADPLPRTSPTCRAAFCGPGCTLPATRFIHEVMTSSIDWANNSLRFTGGPAADIMRDGWLRWLDGPQAGLTMQVVSVTDVDVRLDVPLDPALTIGTRALLREGCDHTIASCADRYGNAANFQGEPFLPGNDLLVRYPVPAT